MINTAPFRFPRRIDTKEKRQEYSLEIIGKLRHELLSLRVSDISQNRQILKLEACIKELESSNAELSASLREARDRVRELELTLHREKKTTNRYRVSLFDSGNFSKPEEREKKPKGGQKGHQDTNRESREDTSSYERRRVYTTECVECGTPLPRTDATRQKQLIDIKVNPELVKVIIESERQWCPVCKKEICAKDEGSLPFTEYGINIVMVVLILRIKGHQSLGTISGVLESFWGLNLCKSSVSNLLSATKEYLGARYEKLKQEIRGGKIMYNDETGWRVRGRSAWMWIMANETKTVYVAAESRGKGIMSEMYGDSQAYSMHDGYAAYLNTIPKKKQLKCWAHILRFAYEETHGEGAESLGVEVRDNLVEIFQLREKKEAMSLEDFEELVRSRMDELLDTTIEDEDVSARAMLNRLDKQKEGLIRSLLLSPDGTNNLAERGLRPIAISRKISHGSDTFGGMETTAILSSIVQSVERNRELVPTLKTHIRTGIRTDWIQHRSRAHFDSS